LLVINLNIDDINYYPKTNNLPVCYRYIIMCVVKSGGGQLSNSKHFANIRKQLIWGNKYIKLKGKSVLFNNWIDSNLIYINYMLTEEGKVSEKNIFKK